MEKNQVKIFLFVFAVFVCGFFWVMTDGASEQRDAGADIFAEGTVSEENEETEKAQKIYVHITGAVKKPGVYIFDEKPRVIEVVEKAGGFKKDALKSGINQAEIVEDGAQIVIAGKKDHERAADSGGRQENAGQQGDSGLLNINTATKEELMTLTGIGESKAMSIISYREENGKFKKIEDIMNIPGIKTGVFKKIKGKIRV